MEVSTFELLYRPLTTVGAPRSYYMLKGAVFAITNLEPRPYRYRIGYRVQHSAAPGAPRQAAPYMLVCSGPPRFSDVPGEVGRASPVSNRYYTLFTLEAQQTVLVILLPTLPPISFFQGSTEHPVPPASGSIAGAISLSLPCTFQREHPNEAFVYRAQSDGPVQVRLELTTRSALLPQSWQHPTRAYALDRHRMLPDTASEQRVCEIPPDTCEFFPDRRLSVPVQWGTMCRRRKNVKEEIGCG